MTTEQAVLAAFSEGLERAFPGHGARSRTAAVVHALVDNAELALQIDDLTVVGPEARKFLERTVEEKRTKGLVRQRFSIAEEGNPTVEEVFAALNRIDLSTAKPMGAIGDSTRPADAFTNQELADQIAALERRKVNEPRNEWITHRLKLLNYERAQRASR